MKITHTQPGKYALAAAVLAAGLLTGLRPAQAGSPQTVAVTAFPGADGTYLPSGFSITAGSGASSNTLTFTSSDGTDIYRHDSQSSTVFPTGTNLIETFNGSSPNGPLTIDFSKPVDGFSLTAQDYVFDHETFTYTVFSGTTSESYTTGPLDNTSPGGAGAHLSAFDPSGITSVQISSVSDQSGGSNDFYVGSLKFLNSSPVPEASTGLSLGVMLALGGLALAARRRGRRTGGTS